MTIDRKERLWCQWRALLRVLAGVALVNLPFWVLGRVIFIDRPLVAYESVVVCALLAWRTPVGAAALLLLWAADAVVALSRIYLFTSIDALLDSLSFIREMRVLDFIDTPRLALMLLFCGSAALLWRLLARRPVGLVAPSLAILILFGLDFLNGSVGRPQAMGRLNAANLVGSPTFALAVAVNTARTPNPLVDIPIDETVQGLVDVPQWAAQHPERGMLLLVIESFGWHNDTAIQAWMNARLLKQLKPGSFDARAVRMPFRGSTTAGELRALCRKGNDYRRLDAHNAAGCLPRLLAAQGWTTVGMHGFSGNMFERWRWWPTVGIGQAEFAEDLLAPDAVRCGLVFRGVCDKDLLDRALAAAAKPRTLAYALTLNTHLPLAATPVPPPLQALCATGRTGPAVCELLAAQSLLLDQLAAGLTRLSVKPLVIVVGDHAPPFSRRTDREQFSSTHVPALLLQPGN
ncbi:hypothetical protein [Aquabacterium sp. OR-4]|uniref:hypothetical protein n=1 Tax=Aquabacterium sp. OR-4 TaxID=2978127 RepID=UPI0028CA0780|nr:hypothetical protein [Aquabacterium sp. OR-4]MDT7834482.1 hypothetical protein [Aquabacterium sp. OR-4]